MNATGASSAPHQRAAAMLSSCVQRAWHPVFPHFFDSRQNDWSRKQITFIPRTINSTRRTKNCEGEGLVVVCVEVIVVQMLEKSATVEDRRIYGSVFMPNCHPPCACHLHQIAALGVEWVKQSVPNNKRLAANMICVVVVEPLPFWKPKQLRSIFNQGFQFVSHFEAAQKIMAAAPKAQTGMMMNLPMASIISTVISVPFVRGVRRRGRRGVLQSSDRASPRRASVLRRFSSFLVPIEFPPYPAAMRPNHIEPTTGAAAPQAVAQLHGQQPASSLWQWVAFQFHHSYPAVKLRQ